MRICILKIYSTPVPAFPLHVIFFVPSLARPRCSGYSFSMLFFSPSRSSLRSRIPCGFPEERYWRSLL
ncbi:hypothetical protein DWUX_1130 [Desulfovibrio diazotrophicus]|nr:hypothetical protein DWUX_1130 [Desulfovibrio diazotrophicus]